MTRATFETTLQAIRELTLEILLPPDHAHFGPLVRDGLVQFLGGLPPARLAEIPAPPAAGEAINPLANWLVAVSRACPSLHKLAQVLARDRRLGEALRQRLQTLESLVFQGCPQAVSRVLQDELGDLAKYGVTLLPKPMAEGSVAVVWPFDHAGGEGVFKILKPDVDQRLEDDLKAWSCMAGYLTERGAELGLPPLDYHDTLDMVSTLLRSEVRLDLEQQHLTTAARVYAPYDDVVVPDLLPWCTARVTAMTRLRGEPITAAAEAGPQLARTLVQALITRPLWDHNDGVFVHGDPHGGNLLAIDSQRVGILDWSLAAHIERDRVRQLVELLLAALRFDSDALARGCLALNAPPRDTGDSTPLRPAVDSALRRLRWGQPPGLNWLVTLLDEVVCSGHVRLDADMLLFRKSLLILEGVVADLDADASMDALVARAGWTQFCSESWHRHTAAPQSREFGTCVSNADLIDLAGAWPGAAWRWYAGWLQDWSRR